MNREAKLELNQDLKEFEQAKSSQTILHKVHLDFEDCSNENEPSAILSLGKSITRITLLTLRTLIGSGLFQRWVASLVLIASLQMRKEKMSLLR